MDSMLSSMLAPAVRDLQAFQAHAIGVHLAICQHDARNSAWTVGDLRNAQSGIYARMSVAQQLIEAVLFTRGVAANDSGPLQPTAA